jgi:cadmium resistance protein CadD (predicted permease)
VGELLALIGAAIVAFVATNVDDVVLITALFALTAGARGGGLRAGDVWIGQYAGLLAVVALSAIGAFGLLLVPDEVVGLLGLIPLTMGLAGLWRAARGEAGDDDEPPPLLPTRRGWLSVAGITIANGADNVAVYVPFFASAGAGGMAVIAVVFAAGVALLCLAGRWLGTHPRTVEAVERWGHWVVPLVFVALGAAIVAEAWL